MGIPITDEDQSHYKEHKEKIATMAYNMGVKVMVFTEELRRLCKVHGYNFPGMWVQSAHETGHPKDGTPFKSELWSDRTNPCGLKNASGNKYQLYYNGVDAARAFVVHMSAYVEPPKVPDRLVPYRFLDNRYMVALNANKGNGKKFVTFDDLSGYWAEDREYGRKISEKYKLWLGDTP